MRRFRTILIATISVALSACTGVHSTKADQPEADGTPSANKHTYRDDSGRLHLTSENAYEATYSDPSNFAYQTEHVYRDGAGHIRVDLSGQGPTVVNVLDINRHETIAWSQGSNTFVRRPCQPTDTLVMRVRAENMPRTEGALGQKTIDGHNCHGYKMAGTEIWFDDRYNCPVVITAGGQTTTMTQFSDKVPDSSLFKPPAGYVRGRNSASIY